MVIISGVALYLCEQCHFAARANAHNVYFVCFLAAFGFLDEMQAAVTRLPALKRLMLTSATDMESIPQFIRRCAVADRAGVRTVNFLGEAEAREERLEVKTVPAPQKDKLETLARLLSARVSGLWQ